LESALKLLVANRDRERERETQTNEQTKRGTHVFSIFIFWQLLLPRGGRFVVVCFEEKLEEITKSNLGKAANATNDASSSFFFFFFFFFFERLSREQRENGRRNDDVVASGNGCCVGVVSDD
jgi:hypothetical protein